MTDILSSVEHRPWPIAPGPWAMTQRWNDLLFAHWPIPPEDLEPLIPEDLVLDTFDGSAWLGVVPFWMDRIQMRGAPMIPGANRFPELNLRTYVRQRNSNLTGVYFFSLDASNLAAVATARLVFRLPYYWARMSILHRGDRDFEYHSERILSRPSVRFHALYRGLGRIRALEQSRPGTIEHFLTERYCLYTVDPKGRLLRGNIHHLPWPLEAAEAQFTLNELPASIGIRLPDVEPLLHYSRELAVYIWPLEPVLARHLRPSSAAALPAAKPL